MRGQVVRRVSPGEVVPCTQLETLTAAGFSLAASPPEPYHYDVLLGMELTDSVLVAFDHCLEAEPRRSRP
jgi:hypothetical protein